jgi:hypothetical protein
MDNRVVNLSDHILTEDEYSVLAKGLKFCPTPGHPDPGELRDDLDRVHKRLRQIAFYDKPIDDPEGSITQDNAGTSQVIEDVNNLNSFTPFKHRKFKRPARGQGPPGPLNLEAMILSNERDLNNRNENVHLTRRNLTPGETLALKNLSKNDKIVIKPSDKGSATVILNRLDYLAEGCNNFQMKDHIKN